MTCRAGGRIGDLERRIAIAEENVAKLQGILRAAHDKTPGIIYDIDPEYFNAPRGGKGEPNVTRLPAFTSGQAPIDYVASTSPRTAD